MSFRLFLSKAQDNEVYLEYLTVVGATTVSTHFQKLPITYKFIITPAFHYVT